MSGSALIIDLLGGPGVVGSRRKATDLELDELVRRGLPVRSLDVVAALFRIATDSLVPVLGSSRATLERRRAQGGALTPSESDGLFRLASTVARAEDVFGSRKAALDWVMEPQRGLGNRKPYELLATTPGYHLVKELLGRIEHGVYT